MKLPTSLMYMAFVTMLLFSCSIDPLEEDVFPNSLEVKIPETKTIELEILDLINSYRVELGLTALDNLKIIKAQAYSHTDYMIAQNNMSHDYFFARKSFLQSKTGASRVAENVAFGFSTAESVVSAWLNSEDHRNTIEGDFTDFDISAEQNEFGFWFYTNIFIKK